jgi:4-amino-4-deoxy-L-arabinose transferase-like glycosyltransferase
LLYGAVTAVAGSHLKLLRVVDLAFGCGTVLVAFSIAERLYERRTALAAGLLLLASPLFQRIASAATNDMPLTFLFCLSVLLGLRLLRDDDGRSTVLLGLVIGCGLLVKYTMVLVLPVLLALVWCMAEGAPVGTVGRPRSGTGAGAFAWLRDTAAGAILRRHAPLVLVIAGTILLAWLDHAWSLGILDTQRARLGRLATVTQRSPRWALDSVLFKLPAAVGVAWLPWIALGGVAMWCRRAMQDRFVGCWIALVFVPLALTLPDNRYFLPAFPALAIVAAQALVARPRAAARVLLLALLLCAITVGFYTQIDLGQRAGVFGEPPGAAGKR